VDTQLAFCFEQEHCVGCSACQIACKDRHDLPVGQSFRKVYEVSGGGYRSRGGAVFPEVYAFWNSLSCNHCLNPACVKSCPVGAMVKRAQDGIVVVDKDRCIGCQKCVQSCPYGAPQYDPATRKVGKCDFCLELLSRGKPPACVASCPVRALHYGPLAELERRFGGVRQTKGMPEAGTTDPALVIIPHRHAL
jgi:DMSO reductase, iron-sulfur subunit